MLRSPGGQNGDEIDLLPDPAVRAAPVIGHVRPWGAGSEPLSSVPADLHVSIAAAWALQRLGLSICHGLVAAMGGTIAAENADEGAIFTITLPEGAPAPMG